MYRLAQHYVRISTGRWEHYSGVTFSFVSDGSKYRYVNMFGRFSLRIYGQLRFGDVRRGDDINAERV